MSYSLALSGGGSSEEGVVRKLAAGQMVTVRLQPHGLNTSNQGPVFAELDRAMVNLNIFRAADYRGWGGGERTPDSAGMVVYMAPMKTSQYTAKQVADLVNGAVKGMERTLGVKRLSLVTIKHPRATGDIVQTAPAPAPDGGGLPVPETPAPSGGGSSSGESSEEPNFFTRKIGPVPVWAIGAGVLALGAGLVLVATRKKTASVAKNPRDRLSLRDRYRKRRRGEEWEWPPWGNSEEVEAVEMIAAPPGIATRVKTTWSRGDEKQVLYRLSPPYEYNRWGDTTGYALSSALIIGGRKETVVFASDASGQRGTQLVEGGGLHTLDTDQSIRDLGYTVVPEK